MQLVVLENSKTSQTITVETDDTNIGVVGLSLLVARCRHRRMHADKSSAAISQSYPLVFCVFLIASHMFF